MPWYVKWFIFVDVVITLVLLLNVWVYFRSVDTVYDIQTLPFEVYHDIVVLGAGVTISGHPSPILRDRLETAIYLANTFPIDRIHLAGDGYSETHNEVESMKSYLINRIPDTISIEVVPLGIDTYSSFKYLSSPSPSTIVVTQSFHMGRALLYCELYQNNCLGVKAITPSQSIVYTNYIREFFANIKASIIFMDIHINRLLWM